MEETSLEPTRQKSRLRLLTLTSGSGERHASWLELFFDLVFVLAIAQVAQVLAKSTDFSGFLKYVVLFIPLWWTWVVFTFYADRFETNDIPYRLLTFTGMLGVAAVSLTLGDAFTPTGDISLVVAYVLVRLILIALYARSAYHVPLARGLSLQFVSGFGTAVAVLLASLVIEPPVRYYVWAVAVLLELATPFLSLRLTRLIPYDYSHIPERFGLFTMLVLGEAVLATSMGLASVSWTPVSIATASIGFAMAACIWWINFEFVEDDAIKSKSLGPRFVYLYGHYFIVASIVAIGIGVEHAIKDTGEGHLHFSTLALIGGGIATYFASITVVKLAADICRMLLVRIATIVVALSLIFLGLHLPPIAVITLFFGILVWGVWLESHFGDVREREEVMALIPCEHSEFANATEPRSLNGCEECIKNNYKWVHLRLCVECGHVGCCDTSRHKHATKHFHQTDHAVMMSLEEEEDWAWCYVDERYVPVPKREIGHASTTA